MRTGSCGNSKAPSRASSTKHWSPESLDAFNLLDIAIWVRFLHPPPSLCRTYRAQVFDIENRSLWWANTAAVALWNAESHEALLRRSFSDMSEATVKRLSEYMRRFKCGETVVEQWTFYPGGRSVTANLSNSGIILDDGRMAMLCAAVPAVRSEINEHALRSVESLRHLPVAVEQLNLSGEVHVQNPSAVATFGSTAVNPRHVFTERFVERNLGERFVSELKSGKQYCSATVEAQLKTQSQGTRWFAIEGRHGMDPVTSDPCILVNLRDVDQRKHAELEMQGAKDEAEAANRSKCEFYAVMTHEIRTPLYGARHCDRMLELRHVIIGIIGFAELLSETILHARQRSFLDSLHNSAVSLMAIINDLLDFSKLEAGQLQLEAVAFELDSVIESALEVVRPKAEDKGISLDRCGDRHITAATFLGDPTRVRQILLNLASNAVKYTEVGSVMLDTSSKDTGDDTSRVRIEVRDTGIGIAAKDMEKLFRPFSQTEAYVERKFGGAGLGLAICKTLVDSMGGNIGVESHLSKGSTFWIELPLRRVPASDVMSTTSNDTATAPNTPRLGAGNPQQLTVLVAEDNHTNQLLARTVIEKMGHRAIIVENGKLAVEAIRNEAARYHLVLMDMQMPELGGIDATRQIRALGYDRTRLPIIGITADYRSGEYSDYIQAGMNHCIGKPCRLRTLRAAIGVVATELAAKNPEWASIAKSTGSGLLQTAPDSATSGVGAGNL